MLRLSALTGGVCAAILVLLGACEQGPRTPSNSPSLAQDDTTHHGGSVMTTLPARTGSQASGLTGSSTTIGAPAKDETGLAFAHN